MAKTIISFNANDQVAQVIQDLKDNGKNVTAFVNKCILESQKPKAKPLVSVLVE